MTLLLVILAVLMFLGAYGAIRKAMDNSKRRKVLSELLKTPEGRQRIAQSMVEKLR